LKIVRPLFIIKERAITAKWYNNLKSLFNDIYKSYYSSRTNAEYPAPLWNIRHKTDSALQLSVYLW